MKSSTEPEVTTPSSPPTATPADLAVLAPLAARFGPTLEELAQSRTDLPAEPKRRNQLGLTHLSFLVDDVDVAACRLVELGGEILPLTRQRPGIDLVFLADPDGTRVELMGRIWGLFPFTAAAPGGTTPG